MPEDSMLHPDLNLDSDLSTSLQDDALREFWQKLGKDILQATRKFHIDRIDAASGMISDVSVEKVNLGIASIGRVEISGLEADLNSSRALLRGVRTLTELHFTLDWKIDLGFIGEWSGSDSLGSIDIPFRVGDITIPNLNALHFEVPSVVIPNIQAEMAPITGLRLGETRLETLSVEKTDLPAEGLQVAGLGVGQVRVTGVKVPSTETQSVTVGRILPMHQIVLPEATVHNVKVPQTEAKQVQSPAFSSSAEVASRSLTVNLGILKLKLHIKPVVHLAVDSMVLSDIKLATLVKRIQLKEISVPVALEGIKASGIDLSNIRVNEFVF